MPEQGYPSRPHKWHQVYFYLRPRTDTADPRRENMSAQDLLSRLGFPDRYPLPGIAVEIADPGCLDYYGIHRPK